MKRLTLFGTLCLTLLMTALDGNATTPTVSSSPQPAASSGVPVNTTVQVIFNTAMTTSTVNTSTFYIQDTTYNCSVTTPTPVATNSSKTFTITPSSPLAYCTSYTMKVTTGVKSSDTSTNMLATSSRTFATSNSDPSPTVTVAPTSPTSGQTGVIETAPVTFTFNKLMDPTTIIYGTTFTLVDTPTSTQVPGNITSTVTTTNKTIVTFQPTTTLVSGTQYRATVSAGANSKCGASVATTFWTFTVRDTIAPYVLSTVPSNNASQIARTSPITINFSEAVQPITAANITVNDGTSNIAGTVTFDSVSKLTATFTPASAMNYDTIYTVTVTGAKDLSSNTMSPNPYTFQFITSATTMDAYCQIPPFIGALVPPNVLLILDNSNSMDEDFLGNAVGSWNVNSKAVTGKSALISIIQKYADTMRIGLMTYRQASSANKYNLSNSGYFTSYDPKSYCPTPPMDSSTGLDYCFDCCSTGISCGMCQSECQAQNSSFDATKMDEVITSRAIGDALRTKYCGLVYPKTIQTKNPTDLTHYIYFKQALPYYNSGTGNEYDYATPTYTPAQEITNTTTATDSYARFTTKTGTSDAYVVGNPGYGGGFGSTPFDLTDSDIAAGYGNLGRRMFSAYTGGRAWFINSSPGGGYLKITADGNDNVNTQKNKLVTALATYAGSGDTGYMDTCSGDPNGCSYIVSAGLTPTAGTLRSATNYFNGATDYKTSVSYTSPIQYPCQKSYIIYVTDGAPSVNESGTAGAATDLMGADTSPAAGTVLNRLDGLRSIARTIGGKNYTFDVKTYVLGMGLTDADKTQLERMGVHGGTSQAYYADQPAQLNDALNSIFTDITTKVSSGTAASILSNNDNNGSMLLQAIFYPKKVFDAQAVSWTGELHGLWYYIDPFLMTNSIREDSDQNDILNLKLDKVTRFKFDPPPIALTSVDLYQDADGNGSGDSFVNNVTTDAVNSLWRAGKSLWLRNLTSSPRTIYTSDGTNRISFSTGNDVTLRPWLNVTTTSIADDIINFISGNDISPNPLGYRGRNAAISGTSGTWRLGDIISSTPRLQTGVAFDLYDMDPPNGYKDTSYSHFIGSSDYQNRGMAFVGANDGMLHAFNLGKLSKAHSPADGDSFSVSKVSDYYTGGLGKEMWGFIPKNALPYLKFQADANYDHLYSVDGSPYINDVAINPVQTATNNCNVSNYWTCDKVTTLNGDNSLNKANTSWRSVLIVGMGLGGASRNSTGTCNSTTGVFPNCVNTPIDGLGNSSYTALDVTDPTNPQYLWEFAPKVCSGTTTSCAADSDCSGGHTCNSILGYATTGTVITRIGDKNRNGQWYAVFASGPTGPIDTINHQFMAASDQNLKIFIVDVKTGTLVRTIDTGITEAFAGSLSNAAIDTNRTNSADPGFYSDDAIYLGYVKKDTATGTWTKGGVLRIFTQEITDTSKVCSNSSSSTCSTNADCGTGNTCLTLGHNNPALWTFSKVIDGIGAVTSGIGRIQEDPRVFTGSSSRLWLYFGTGRYFYKNSTGLDDNTTQQSLYGIIEPCYQNGDINQSCSDSINISRSASNGLQDQTSTITTSANGELPADKKGWVIDLAVNDTTNNIGAQRVITDTVPLVSGVVLYTTFKPNAEICGFGGTTSLWAVTYNGGAAPAAAALQGQGVIQLSTGSFEEVQLNSATFTNSLNRESTSYQGVPPPTPPAFFTKAGMQPQKKILRIQEN